MQIMNVIKQLTAEKALEQLAERTDRNLGLVSFKKNEREKRKQKEKEKEEEDDRKFHKQMKRERIITAREKKKLKGFNLSKKGHKYVPFPLSLLLFISLSISFLIVILVLISSKVYQLSSLASVVEPVYLFYFGQAPAVCKEGEGEEEGRKEGRRGKRREARGERRTGAREKEEGVANSKFTGMMHVKQNY